MSIYSATVKLDEIKTVVSLDLLELDSLVVERNPDYENKKYFITITDSGDYVTIIVPKFSRFTTSKYFKFSANKVRCAPAIKDLAIKFAGDPNPTSFVDIIVAALDLNASEESEYEASWRIVARG